MGISKRVIAGLDPGNLPFLTLPASGKVWRAVDPRVKPAGDEPGQASTLITHRNEGQRSGGYGEPLVADFGE